MIQCEPSWRCTSPACGGGRREAPGGGSLLWGIVPLRRHPLPCPPPQAGEGAHLACGYGDIQSRHAATGPDWRARTGAAACCRARPRHRAQPARPSGR
ncbi:hypothetical protein GTH44_31460 [Bradyrhizobium japonicum]|nr:hypothetical protein [Bradyrhizobium japonicum]